MVLKIEFSESIFRVRIQNYLDYRRPVDRLRFSVNT